MKKMLIGGMLLAYLVAIPFQAVAQSAFDGTWKVDINQVRSAGKPMVTTLKNGVYTCDCTPPITVKADGMDHPVAGHARIDSFAVSVVDDHTITETGKKAGAVVNVRTIRVAPDGKTATFESTATRPEGSSTVKGTLARLTAGAPGSHAVAGAWKNTGYQSASESMMSYTYKVDGDTVSMKDGQGESYTAKLDGKPVPYAGDPGTEMIAVKMDGKALEETAMRGGRATSVARMSLSPDGNTMTTVILYKPSGREITLVAAKQ